MPRSISVTKWVEAHHKQLQELHARIQEVVAPVVKGQGEIARAVKPILESQQSFQVALERAINPFLENLQKRFRELPAKAQEALIRLGDNGWYFDLELPVKSLLELDNALNNGDVQEAEEALVRYHETRLGEIEESLVRHFRPRDKIIRAAFSAHRRGEYELAIPVLLAQADGICKELINENLFLKRDKKPSTATYVERIAEDTLERALLSPLAQSLPIDASEKERGSDFTGLNRHMVLHGESLDYGTKVNSLKSVSLINYVAKVLKADHA